MRLISFLFFLVFSVQLFSQPAMLDSSFGTNGVVTTNISSGGDFISSLAIQPDGKIVVAGNLNNGSIHDFVVARYMSDGSLDTTFSLDGITTFGFDSASYNQASGVAIQTDGKIVVTGISNDSSQHFALARLNPDGAFDTTFSGDGKLKTSFGIQYDLATCIAIQSDGKIIVAGASVNNPYFTYAFTLARYLTDGTLDSTFSNDGFQIVSLSVHTNIINSIILQPDGKILAAGYSDGFTKDFAVARFLPDGTLDSSFSSDGFLSVDIPPFFDDEARSILVQPDGKIVVAGTSEDNNQPLRLAVLRFLSDGRPDSTFNLDGVVVNSFSYHDVEISSVLLQPNGKILVAGGDTTFALTRYSSDGYLDYSLDQNGIFSPDIGQGIGSAAAMQSDGKIIIAGSITNGSNMDFAIARYITNVTLSINESKDEDSFVIYPNPIHDKAILKFKNSNFSEVVFTLQDLTGRLVYEKRITGNEFVFERGILNSGLYIWTLTESKGKCSGAGKVVLD